MRTGGMIAILIVCTARLTFAQQKHEFSIFLSQSNTYRATRGYGAAFNQTLTPRFSVQIALAVEEPTVCVGGSFLTTPCTQLKLRTYPVDLTGRYHFLNETRWKPYVGLGMRYAQAPHLTPKSRTAIGHGYPNHLDPQVVGGVELLINPSFGVTVDAKQLLANSEAYDPRLKASVGLSWRF